MYGNPRIREAGLNLGAADNTVPEFGMYPYRPQAPNSYSIHEVKGLSCRPCSKIGFAKCPKGHFKCMMDQDVVGIKAQIDKFLVED